MVLTLFRAGMRVVSAADHAVAQKLRDDDIVFPRNPKVPFEPGPLTENKFKEEVEGDDDLRDWINAQGLGPQYASMLANAGKPENQATVGVMNKAFDAYILSLKGETHGAGALEAAEAISLQQWIKGEKNEPQKHLEIWPVDLDWPHRQRLFGKLLEPKC